MRLPNVLSKNCSRMTVVIAVELVLLACAIHAAELRTWTDDTGKFSVQAELVEVKDGQAVLKKSDGETVSVAVSRLSKADQEYVQQQVQKPAAVRPVANARTPVDTTGLNLTFPNAMTEPPDWLANDLSVPFDVKAFFQAPPPEENAAPLYLLAFSDYDLCLYLHVHGIDEKKDPVRARQVREAHERSRSAWYSIFDQYDKSELDPPTAEEPSLEAIDKVIEAYRPSFDVILQAQQRPQCVFEPGYSAMTLLLHAAAQDVSWRLDLVLRSAIRRGKPDEAIETVRTTLRLSRDLRPRGPATIQLVASRIEGNRGISVYTWIYQLLSAPSLTVAHCDQLLSLLREHRQSRIDGFADACKSGYITSRLLVRDFQIGTWKSVLQEWGLSGPRTQATYLRFLQEQNIDSDSFLMKQHPFLSKLKEGTEAERTEAVAKYAMQIITMTDDDYAQEVRALNECYAALLALRDKSNLERLPALNATLQPLLITAP